MKSNAMRRTMRKNHVDEGENDEKKSFNKEKSCRRRSAKVEHDKKERVDNVNEVEHVQQRKKNRQSLGTGSWSKDAGVKPGAASIDGCAS